MLTPHKRAWERPFQSAKAKHTCMFRGPGGTEELARAATRNEPWGPTGTQLNELAALSHQGQCDVIFGILRERLEDPRSSRWRKVYKALQTVEFLAKRGAPCCVMSAQQLTPIMQFLQETYTHQSSDGKDTGKNVRIRAAAVLCLLKDVEGLNAEREYFAKRAATGQQPGVMGGEVGAGGDAAHEHAQMYGVTGSPDGTSMSNAAIAPSRTASDPPALTGGQAARVTSEAPNMKVQMTPEQKAEVCAALARVLTMEGNAVCADCGQTDGMRPTWASTSCGVLLCMRCAGVHRSLGVHVSKVRSITMDKWTPALVDAMERAGGNARANAYFEALLPQGHARPKNQEVERFIFNKYALRRWAQPDAEWPPPPPYSTAATADVIATSAFDLQQGDAAAPHATPNTSGGGAATGAAKEGKVECQPGMAKGAAEGVSHAQSQQNGAQNGADVNEAAKLEAESAQGVYAAAESEAALCQAGVEFDGVVLGQEVLVMAMGMSSPAQGVRRLHASGVAADASSVPSSCSAAVLRAAHAGGTTSAALRGTPAMPPHSMPTPPPPMEPPRPATPPAPEPQPEEQKTELGDLLGPELGGEEEQGLCARSQEKQEEDRGLAAELQALPPTLDSTTHLNPPHPAPCTPDPKIWTPRPPFYVTTTLPPPPLLLPPSYPEELRPSVPPLLLPPQHIEGPMPGQFLLGPPPSALLPNGPAFQGGPHSYAAPPLETPPTALPLQESPTLQMGLEELAAAVPAGRPGPQEARMGGAQQDGSTSVAGAAGAAAAAAAPAAAAQAPAFAPAAAPAPASAPAAAQAPAWAPAAARAPVPAPMQPWAAAKGQGSFSALASTSPPPACAQLPTLCAEPTLGVPPPPAANGQKSFSALASPPPPPACAQLPTRCAEPTLGVPPPPAAKGQQSFSALASPPPPPACAQLPTHCAEPTLGVPPPPAAKGQESFSALASPPPPPACAQLPTHCAEPTLGVAPPPAFPPSESITHASAANVPVAASEPTLGAPPSPAPASAAMAAEESLPPSGDATAPPVPGNAGACCAMQSPFAMSLAAAAAAAASM